jgi:nicotinate-nucleotide adenylyltransferase
MPAHTSPFKPGAPDPGPEHRLRMCELLVARSTRLSACALELKRGGISYTVDTLSAIHVSHPDAELTFIIGADTAGTLAGWRDPARLLELAGLAVAQRPGTDPDQVLRSLSALGADGAGDPSEAAGARSHGRGVRFLDMPLIDVSSSAVRRRMARGDSIDQLVGAEVARYIEQHGLYRRAGGAGG